MEKLAGTFPDCVMVKQGFSFGLANASVQEYWCTNLGLHNQDQEVRLPTSPAPLKREWTQWRMEQGAQLSNP